jgi:hypothetical protein
MRNYKFFHVQFPADFELLLDAAESAENWVENYRARTQNFPENLNLLGNLLLMRRVRLSEEVFLKHFVAVSAFAGFRENLGLMKALGERNPHLLNALLKRVTRGAYDDPRACWGALKWRMRYAMTFDVLTRVFSEERLALIRKALVDC